VTGRVAGAWRAFQEFLAGQLELQERLALINRPWEEEFFHWGPDDALHGRSSVRTPRLFGSHPVERGDGVVRAPRSLHRLPPSQIRPMSMCDQLMSRCAVLGRGGEPVASRGGHDQGISADLVGARRCGRAVSAC
jgi:hypothetical protein